MGPTLKALLLTDSRKETHAGIRRLEYAFGVTVGKVSTCETLETSINGHGWDVVICVLKSPLDAAEAVRAIRKGGSQAPVIVVDPETVAGKASQDRKHATLGKGKLIASMKEVSGGKAEEMLRVIFDSSPDACCLANRAGKIIECNAATERLTGYRRKELLGKSIAETGLVLIRNGETLHDYMSHHRKQLREPQERVIVGKDGKRYIAEVQSLPVSINGEPGVLGIARDMSDRKRLVEEIRNQAKFVSENPSPMLRIDENGMLLYANPSSRVLLEDWHCDIDQRVPEYVRKLTTDVLAKGKKRRVEIPLGGRIFAFEIVPVPGVSYVNLYGSDISESRKLEQQLFTSQKMESLGLLAGGVAHDFNNLLTGILGYASYIKMRPDKINNIAEYVDIIEESARRAAELTSQLLSFARGEKFVIKPVDINEVVRHTLRIISRTFDKLIEIESRLESAIPTVGADAMQLGQVVMNLCVNARDAMPLGGRLTIETGTAEMDDTAAALLTDAKPGSYVYLSVTDTGVGMEKETVQRIFEPFFSTKETGRGTGLGLSVVYGIVKNHGGFITVNSEPGKGTTLKVYMPQCGKEKKTPSSRMAEPPAGGNELVLVIDDEETIQALTKRILEHNGYSVITTAGAAEGIELYGKQKEEIRLVILDMVMPKISSAEVFDRLMQINGDVRVLLSTGYGESEQARTMIENGVRDILRKPFNVADLLKKVREIIDMP